MANVFTQVGMYLLGGYGGGDWVSLHVTKHWVNKHHQTALKWYSYYVKVYSGHNDPTG